MTVSKRENCLGSGSFSIWRSLKNLRRRLRSLVIIKMPGHLMPRNKLGEDMSYTEAPCLGMRATSRRSVWERRQGRGTGRRERRQARTHWPHREASRKAPVTIILTPRVEVRPADLARAARSPAA